MASLYDSASLVMIPSGYKDDKLYSIKPTDGSGDFTFSRDGSGASPATRVNASGLIEKGRENVLLYSNQPNLWSVNSASLTGGQSGYDGSSDAWLFDSSAGFIRNNLSLSGVYTYSIYAKQGTADGIRLRMDAGTDANVYISLTDGSESFPSTGIDYTATSIGGGWWRVSVTHNDSAFSNFRVYAIDGSGNSTTGTIYIQDAQVEQGLVATDYIETTTAPVSAGLLGDMPRLDYSGGATCPSLLLEPSRVNLFNYSEASSEWVVTRARNEIGFTSPEGVANATKVIPNTDNDSHYTRLTDSVSQTFVNGTTYTISFYVKAAEYSTFVLSFVGITADTAEVDLSDESHNVGELENAGNGWYRFYYTFTADDTSSQIRFFPNTNNDFVGNDSDGILIYGAQLESASYPTSYIPTYGSASGRAEDFCNDAGTSSTFNDTQGTLFVETKSLVDGDVGKRISITDGSSSNRVLLESDDVAGRFRAFVSSNGTTETPLNATGIDQSQNNKIALVYDSTSFKMYINGALQDNTSISATPIGLSTLYLANSNAGADQPLLGHTKQVLYFPTALTDAECIALTTI